MCGIAPGGAIMAATHKTKGTFEGADGAICLNGSPGSPKSSFSFVCEGHLIFIAQQITWSITHIILRKFLILLKVALK